MTKAVEFQCEIFKVQSVATGGYRVTLNLHSGNKEQAAWMLGKSDETGALFRVIIVEDKDAVNIDEPEEKATFYGENG